MVLFTVQAAVKRMPTEISFAVPVERRWTNLKRRENRDVPVAVPRSQRTSASAVNAARRWRQPTLDNNKVGTKLTHARPRAPVMQKKQLPIVGAR
jgi:hypothetical protein